MASILTNRRITALAALLLAVLSANALAGWGTTATETSPQFTSLITDAQRGRWVWLKYNCAGCHGDRAAGGMAPNIQFKQTQNVKDAVTGGTSAMPNTFVGITTKDITLLTTYLNSFGKAGEPLFICWWKSPINDLNYNGTGTRPNCNP